MTDFLFTNFPHFVFGFDRLDGVHDPVPGISGDSLNGNNALIYATLGCIFMWNCACVFMWKCAPNLKQDLKMLPLLDSSLLYLREFDVCL